MEELKGQLGGGCVDFGAEQETVWEEAALCDEAALNRFLERGALEEADLRN